MPFLRSTTLAILLAVSAALLARFDALAADGALDTPAARKAALTCQKLVVKILTKTASSRLKAVDSCARAALTCTQTKKEKSDCPSAAATTCEKKLRAADTAAGAAIQKLVAAKSCGQQLDRTALLSADGLGLGALAGQCATDFDLDVCEGIEPLAQCLVQTHDHTAAALYALANPRTAELLGLLPSSTLPSVTGLPVHHGCGDCSADPAQRKPVEQCAKALSKATQDLVARLGGSFGKCRLGLFECAQAKAGSPECQTKTTNDCQKHETKVAAAIAKFHALVAKGCPTDFADLAADDGLNLQALANVCSTQGVPTLSSVDTLTQCLGSGIECQSAALAGEAIPRTQEFIASGDLALATSGLEACPVAEPKTLARTTTGGRAGFFGSIVKFIKRIRRSTGVDGLRKDGGPPPRTPGAGRRVTHLPGGSRITLGGITKLSVRYGAATLGRAAPRASATAEPVTLLVGVARAGATVQDHYEIELDPIPPGETEKTEDLFLEYPTSIDGCAFNLVLATRTNTVVSDYTPVLQVVDQSQTPPPSSNAERVSLGPGGIQGNGNGMFHVAVSATGRFVAFDSEADNLLGPGGDGNGKRDVFVRDRCVVDGVAVDGCQPATERVSIGVGDVEADGEQLLTGLSISASGRFVVFASDAENLLGPGGDANHQTDVYLRDRCVTDDGPVAGCTATIERVSIGINGEEGNSTSRVSGVSSISADGRFVAFSSLASNLLGVGGDTNGRTDVFVRDRCLSEGDPVPGCTATTERVNLGPGSVASAGGLFSDSSSISDDGRFVGFVSDATNLLGAGGDGNGKLDVFLRDRCVAAGVPVPGCSPTTERINLGPGGLEADDAGGAFLYDPPAISADGRFVAFVSKATNLLGPGGDTNGKLDVFLRDRCIADGLAVPGCAAATQRLSVGPGGVEGDADSGILSSLSTVDISTDGRFVEFASAAHNLLGGSTGAGSNVFVYDRCVSAGTPVGGCTPGLERVTQPLSNSASLIIYSSLSATGRFVGLVDVSNALLGPTVDTNGNLDAFIIDRGS